MATHQGELATGNIISSCILDSIICSQNVLHQKINLGPPEREGRKKMWRLVLRPLDLRHCSWRRCITILSILLVVNTAFHWTLVDDIHSRPGKPGQQSAISMSRDGGGLPFRDRVISINKWYDELKKGTPDGKGIDFDVDHVDDDNDQVKKRDEESLITYITRKPSNRRPLGELQVSTKRSVVDYNHFQPKLQSVGENNLRNRRMVSSFDSALNESEIVRKVEISRKEIDSMRERVYTRKREIRNRSMTESVEKQLLFLRHSKTKLRPASTSIINPKRDRIVKLIQMAETAIDHAVLEVYSNETIRFYSQPNWLYSRDINEMNFLAGSWVLSRRQGERFSIPLSVNRLVLASNDEIERLADNYERTGEKADTEMECHQSQHTLACQPAWCSVDLSLVVAFHLDRVIGLNVTPPTVARELPLGTRHPPEMQHVSRSKEMQGSSDGDLLVRVVALIVTSSRKLHSRPAERGAADHYRVMTRGATEGKLEFSSNVSEKLFIFCYLLKVSNCSTEIWKTYFNSSQHPHRSEQDNDSINKTYCDTNTSSPIRVFQSSIFPDPADSIMLKRFKRVSDENMDLLQAGRIRQRLLQSLFLDRVFWTEAGGRHGIETLLDVIDGRVKELFQWLSRFSSAKKKRRKI